MHTRLVWSLCLLLVSTRFLPINIASLTFGQGAIGVLDRTEMDHFATLFVAYQKRGKSEDQDGETNFWESSPRSAYTNKHVTPEIAKLNEQLAPWTGPQALGLQRANCRPDGYSVK